MSIAGLVLGIIALLFAFVPFLGVIAVFPGVLGLLLALIDVIIKAKKGGGKAVGIVAIVLCALAIGVSTLNFHASDEAVKELDRTIQSM